MRQVVYRGGLMGVAIATTLTLLSVSRPYWITLSHPPLMSDSIGLYQRCTSSSSSSSSSQTRTCNRFPDERKCPLNQGNTSNENSFCSMWSTAGAVTALIVPLMEFLTLAVMMVKFRFFDRRGGGGGRGGVQEGWKAIFPAGMVILAAGFEGFGVAVMAYIFDNDEMFLVPGYELGLSWYLALMSSAMLWLTASWMVIGSWILPEGKEKKEEEEEEERESECCTLLNEKSRV
ncbi:hypothetical protein QBC42DRAFT_278601 [Cladorrhinum samala]|uniref:Uncharacterized protein n=1 Tax=Cladorrhinum samala TaxID=585594 RepID=A0AAV9HDR4_9PEZI|nr:hypothetical protein QBC42DRAFT_278601 [Cladorrhinum samala]